MSKKKKITATATEDTFIKKSPQHSSVEGNTILKVNKGQKIIFTPKENKEDNHLEIRYIKVEERSKIIPIACIWTKHWKIEQ
ncbi:unnamed protein product [Commensalibacter communis]|uniref:hypothetical protein n=1 Tax=Commensalibacter communis TaxID=2972786 RepID=UPI0022FF7CA1|nr:hypothetical protein [Commensalibacter communis]CAI3933871.1 unnamed protein product [Commensalibacter communis]